MRWIGQHSEWVILTGFLPAALAIAVFEVLIDPELISILIDDLGRGLHFVSSFVRGLVLMSTFVACYVAVCLALLGYFSLGFARSGLPADSKRAVAGAGIVSWIAFHAVLAGLGSLDLRLFSIAYDSLVAIYERAGDPVAAAMTGDALGPGISRHLASILLPASAGVAAVCAGSCHAIAIVHEAKSGQTKPEEAVNRLLHGFMAMSGLLVASTLLLTLSFRLPAALYGTGEAAEARITEYLGFANVLSAFWGAVFTLTLVAVYAPHALALRSLSGMPLGQFLSRAFETGSSVKGLVQKTEVAVSTVAPLLAALTAYLI